MDRIILHCDLNNFYASVECLLNPALKTHPIAVCGNPENRHGIVLAKNDLAKKYGVKTGEVIWQAKQKCSGLVTVAPHHNYYPHYSKLAKSIYYRFTDQVEPFGIDECWLDVTASTSLFGDGYDIASQIKETIKSELGLTISVGVSFNKVFAKLGSDLKKPDAISQITRSSFKSLIWPLSASSLLGVGPATSRKLLLYGIHTIGELANTSSEFLKKILGENGYLLWTYANGLDTSPVHAYAHTETLKSVGNSITCKQDLLNQDEVWQVFLALSESVSSRLRENQLIASGIQITVKDTHLMVKQFQAHLPFSSRTSIDLAQISMSLFKRHIKYAVPIRALGVRAINLSPYAAPEQISLFNDETQRIKLENLETTVDNLRHKYGKNIVKKGSLMLESKLPIHTILQEDF